MLVQGPEELLFSGRLLVKRFQWHSKFPSDMCVVMTQECLVGYACRTG